MERDGGEGTEDPRIARAALRAAGETELLPFLRESLSGAMELCAAGAGALTVPPPPEEDRPEEFQVTLPLGEAVPARSLARLSAVRFAEEIGEHGAILPAVPEVPAEPQGSAPTEMLAVPLAAGKRGGGFLLLIGREGRKGFDRRHLERVGAFARALEPLLARVLRIRQLERMVVRDDTTTSYNRRYLEEFLTQETARSRRFRTSLSLIFLDLDDLKAVNSAHGHRMGSLALREVARRISASTRRIDKVFRYGGDEFCVVLPGTDTAGAREVAERIRRAIAGAPLLAEEIPGGVRLTASLGLASFPTDAATAEEMLAAADAAMRSVKGESKNAIAAAPAAPPGPEPAPVAPRSARAGRGSAGARRKRLARGRA